MLSLAGLRDHPGIELAGAFDVREEAVQAFSAEFGGRGFNTLADLLGCRDIDAVYVATPHELHVGHAIAALEAGKHVIVEKPMASRIEDGRAMVAAARAADRVLLVGPSHGYDEPVARAAAMIASGAFGAVRLVTAMNFTDFMYRPRRPEELDSARGGGVVFSQGAHQIDVVRRLVGQEVTSVYAHSANWDEARPTEGAYTALMSFGAGASATLTYSGYGHYDSDELVGWVSELGQPKSGARHGASRRPIAGLSSEQEQAAKRARTYGRETAGAPPVPPHHEHFGFVLASCEKADLKILPDRIEIYGDEGHSVEAIAPPVIVRARVIDAFLGLVANRLNPDCHGQWGLETLACCTALLESSRLGAPVDPRTLLSREPERTPPWPD